MKHIKVEKLQTLDGHDLPHLRPRMYWSAAATRAKALKAGNDAFERWDFKAVEATGEIVLGLAFGSVVRWCFADPTIAESFATAFGVSE